MKLAELLKTWRDDSSVKDVFLAENNEQEDGIIDHLYHILFHDRTADYGRHAGLRVRLNRALEVLEHDIFNMTLDDNGNWVEAMMQWFTGWTTNYYTFYVPSSADTSGGAVDSTTSAAFGVTYTHS